MGQLDAHVHTCMGCMLEHAMHIPWGSRRSVHMHGSAGCTCAYMHGVHARACHAHTLGKSEKRAHAWVSWMHMCIHAWGACSSMPCTYLGEVGEACTCMGQLDAHVHTCMGCMLEHAMHI